jgi:hypothetical protein
MSIFRPSPTANNWSRLSAEARAEILDGAVAIRRPRQGESYEQWVRVGRALLRLQQEAMYLSGSNKPFGRGYIAERRRLGERVPDLEEEKHTNKQHAMWLAKNFELVEQWRGELDQHKRLELNHPSVIKRRYEAAHNTATLADPAAPKPMSANDKLRVKNVRLQYELDVAHATIRRLERAEGDMLLISRNDSPEDILAVIETEIPSKAARIAALLLNRQKPTTPRRRRRHTEPPGEQHWDEDSRP